MFITLVAIIAYSSLAICLILSFKWGGRQEQLTACAFCLGLIGSTRSNTSRYAHVETGILLIDTFILLGLVGLAMRSDRFWPLWAAAFQMLAVCVHIASIAETDDYDWAYAIAVNFWTFPVVFALIISIALESRQRRMAN